MQRLGGEPVVNLTAMATSNSLALLNRKEQSLKSPPYNNKYTGALSSQQKDL